MLTWAIPYEPYCRSASNPYFRSIGSEAVFEAVPGLSRSSRRQGFRELETHKNLRIFPHAFVAPVASTVFSRPVTSLSDFNQMNITIATVTMLSLLSTQRTAAFVARQAFRTQAARNIGGSALRYAEAGQAEVVLVGCGAPNRGEFEGRGFHDIVRSAAIITNRERPRLV